MSNLQIEEYVGESCEMQSYELDDYASEAPRWCKGCGDHGVLNSVQRALMVDQLPPEQIVCVSGIGCSSRFPHYLRAYGLHGIHGRALPLSLGAALSRPDLKVLTVMGDGDCFSIGAGHWLHTLRYNPDMTVLVLDNEIFALTKKQVSPTSPQGALTNTTPHGAYLRNMNPLSVILGIANVSFLAQTATWVAPHMEATIRKAWEHKGLSFVRVLQRCPVFTPDAFSGGGAQFSATFLEHPNGIPINKGVMKKAAVLPHDHHDLNQARNVAMHEDPAPLGLIYWDPEVPTYQDVRFSKVKPLDNAGLIAKLNAEIDKYAVAVDQ